MNILVTGANGFIGSALLQSLQTQGHTIRAAVRKIPSNAFISPFIEYCLIGDIHEQTDWSSALRDVDVVVHLAARVHVMRETAENPLDAFRQVNVRGTQRLVQQAIAANIQRFVYVSSIK